MVVARRGSDSVTVKPSSGSTVVSPATLTVIVLLVWPAAKLTVPEGSTPPAKSAALAGTAAAAGHRPGGAARPRGVSPSG